MDIIKAKKVNEMFSQIKWLDEQILQSERYIKEKCKLYAGVGSGFNYISFNSVEIFEYMNKKHKEEKEELERALAEI